MQVYRSTGVPLVLPRRLTSRHLPLTRTVPSGSASQACAGVPLQAQTSTLVLFADWLPLASRHIPGICETIGPAGMLQDWFAYPLHGPSSTLVPTVLL